MTSVGIDCSQIQSLNLLKQDNMRAGKALIECGVIPGGRASGRTESDSGNEAPVPPNILVSNRPCDDPLSCTKSESMVWSQGSTIVVNYNDSSYGQYTGTSVSTDGGATFTELSPPPFLLWYGAVNFGDPIVVYNAKYHKWFAGDLVYGACSNGLGIGLWTSNDGVNWSVGATCAHSGNNDDRESMWVDNNPASAGYGHMYISYNDFNFDGALFVTRSIDGGTTWQSKQLSNGFTRNVQITGAPVLPLGKSIFPNVPYSTVFVASMDEGNGGLDTRQNLMWRSTDGGNTWTSTIMGPRFAAVGDSTCHGYFAKVNAWIRHMGWGEPAVGPNQVVHYAFAGAGTDGDHGDIFYTRSTDNGTTWSAPIKLNDDPDAQFKTQWMPSLSVTSTGKVTASWYDRRSVNSACNIVTDPGCSYERYGAQSADNGATWGANFVISSSPTPEPEQDDGNVDYCYSGDYDYDTAVNNKAWVTWTDGRRHVGNPGAYVQDVNFAAVPQ
jgi:hypothetical protein